MNLKTLLITLASCAAGVSPVFANLQVEMNVYDAGSGGNYRANPNAELDWVIGNYAAGATDGTWFGTFCIEKNEEFTKGDTYDVVLNDRAIAGGVSSPTPGYDVISQGTAFLYTQFAKGALPASYYGSEWNAMVLQDLIWYLEGEQDSWGIGTYNDILLAQFGSNWMVDAKADYTGTDVKVMNLTSNDGQTLNQDQLIYVGVPDGGATAMLLGLGLFGCALVNRRKRAA